LLCEDGVARLNKVCFSIPIFVLLFVQLAYSSSGVVVEFLYYDPSQDPDFCTTCPTWTKAYEAFLTKNETVSRIETDYRNRVAFNWTQFPERWAPIEHLAEFDSLTIRNDQGNVTTVQGDFNETYIREVIEAYLQDTAPPPPSAQPLIAVLAVSFSFGFFETFSPCLMVLLSFVLSYSLGQARKFRDGLFQVGCFGIGFVGAALFLGLAVGALSFGIGSFYRLSTLIVCVFAILFGLYQMNLFKRTLVETKPLIKTLAKKYAVTYGGLLLLGFAFYFLDPCIAPIFFAMLPLMTHAYLPLILLTFSVGVILPFIFIGLLSGSLSKLTRVTYKHKAKIRTISGLILVGYGAYLLVLFFFAQ
jgi:cytochrome c-type biogenesis protein